MYKVLIADDEPLVIHGLSKQIDWESLNMEITGTATNGQDILSMLAHNPAHLLITDICMPRMDGLTLISRAKLINPSLRCIIISAFNEFEYVKKALQMGVENYLLKPINQSELFDTLSKTLENLVHDQMVVSVESLDILAFRTNILDRWVNGTIQDFELFERADLLQINLSAPDYTVCVLDVIHLKQMELKYKFSSLLFEICRDILCPSFSGECFIDASSRVVIIWHGESRGLIQDELGSYLFKIFEEANSKGIKVFSAVSPIINTFASVSSGYASAIAFLDYHFVDPAATTVFCKDFLDPQCVSLAETHTILMQFTEALKEGKLQQAQLIAEKYFLIYSGYPFPEMRSGILPLVLSLIRAMIESGRLSDPLSAEVTKQLSNFARIDSTDSLEKWLSRTIDDSIHVIRERKGALHILVHLTLELVNNKYDTELSLKTLATSFNVSSAYLGQLFKEETDKYFNDYLMQVRLQASRVLLLESNLKIGEIVRRIGIPNQSYFNRVFKKMYGISPMEFRRQDLNK
ncbi:response regulator transcription factor [Paenibacillus eucommiae]|uniref:YesN/AraC family two-component response regulator n=1 Tax=Paenibacillus eucommiae TaxID=1355755 RepID=A0ABS4ISI9_9BACL|nr:response regulator [Paenibacillus eucommiae]MBP1990533.1 YesN/AraC family two-component response regulator [Paenibacillus eucommiae]